MSVCVAGTRLDVAQFLSPITTTGGRSSSTSSWLPTRSVTPPI